MSPQFQPIQSVLRRLKFRLTLGQTLEIWPPLAAAALFAAGGTTLVCRIFFPSASEFLPWLWLLPLLMLIPAGVICRRRAYRRAEVLALADLLSGGKGLLLAVMETGDSRWREALPPVLERFSAPRLRFARSLWPVLVAVAFSLGALWVPQRVLGTNPTAQMLAKEVTQELQDAVIELRKKDLITTEEQKRLEKEFERLHKSAAEKFDASIWEAADALRERLAAGLLEKQDAMKWAQESLRLLEQAAKTLPASTDGQAHMSKLGEATSEVAKALEKLARTGMLSGLPEELLKMLGGMKALESGAAEFPVDMQSLQELAKRLQEYLKHSRGALEQMAQRAGGGGRRLDPSQFDLQQEQEAEGETVRDDDDSFDPNPGPDGDGEPGRGGVSRGRGDAAMTWGRESKPTNRFQPLQLPTNVPRNPDDWTPVAVIPSAPKVAPETSVAAPAQPMEETAGQAAWRRSLTPRHRSAVKNYFDSDKKP